MLLLMQNPLVGVQGEVAEWWEKNNRDGVPWTLTQTLTQTWTLTSGEGSPILTPNPKS